MAGAVDFDLEYRFYDGKTRLDATELTRRFLSLHLRAVALEEKGSSWDALETQGLSEAIRRINAVITPLITATQGEISGLQSQIAAGLALLEAKVAQAEARLALIIAGGLPATDVMETAGRVFVSPAQRADIGTLRSEVTAIKAGASAALDTFVEVATALDGLTMSLASKLNTSAKATQAQAQAGTDDASYMTAARTKDAIAALVRQARFDNVVILPSSQTWVAPANIRGRVTPVGGSGSGGVARTNLGSAAASGGAAGGHAIKTFTATTGQSYTATVGAAGAVVSRTSDGATPGNAGGTSSFVGNGLNVVANGGAGGNAAIGSTASAAGAIGGTATGGDVNYQGGGSGPASCPANACAAATGGGALAWFGRAYSSGGATDTTNNYAATGGAGVGGKSADATGGIPTGGGSASGASSATPVQSRYLGGPDIYGIASPTTYSTGTNNGQAPPLANTGLFTLTGRGGPGGYQNPPTSGGDAGCGGGAHVFVSSSYAGQSGSGGLFAGGGGFAGPNYGSGGHAGTQPGSGNARFGGGSGAAACVSYTGSNSVSSGDPGGGFIIIEYDVVT